MNFRLIAVLFFCLVIGFFIGKFIIDEYKSNSKSDPVFKETEEVYFIQYGVYSSLDSMDKNTKILSNYIYEKVDDKYHVYIGITSSEKNLDKMLTYFKKKSYSTYVKNIKVSNLEFIELLKKYDELLEKVSDDAVIDTLVRAVLVKYKEVNSE